MTDHPGDGRSAESGGADGQARSEFVERWRDAAYGCYSSGHKFCREVCPVTQVTRNENYSPTAFHANVVAMEKGLLDVGDVADDYVNCTQCGACELRCPNTLFTGDFYRHRTRTVEVVKAMRALAVDSGYEQPEWKRWIERLVDAHSEPVLGEIPIEQEHVADWAEGLNLPVGGETVLFVDCEAAFYRTSYARATAQLLKAGGVEFGLMREQWCCGGPAAEMGYVDQARAFAEHNVADWRAVGAKRIIAADPARLHRLHRGLPELLRRLLRVRDRAGHRPGGRPGARWQAQARAPGAAHRHLPRPVPAEQAQGRSQGSARAAPRRAGAELRRRRSRDPVVVLLGGRRRAGDREARDHGGAQPPARAARGRPGGRHADQRLPVVRAAAVGGRGSAGHRGDGPVRAGRRGGRDRGRGLYRRAVAQESAR